MTNLNWPTLSKKKRRCRGAGGPGGRVWKHLGRYKSGWKTCSCRRCAWTRKYYRDRELRHIPPNEAPPLRMSRTRAARVQP